MTERFEETEYNSVMRNVRFFKRTKKLYNAVLDSDYAEEIEKALDTVTKIITYIESLKTTQVLRNYVKDVEKEFFAASFVVIRAVVLRVTDEKKSNNYRYLESIEKHIQSRGFRGWIETDENRRANMAGYCLLVDADKRNASVQEAFRKVNSYLKEFFENDRCFSRKHIKEEELVQDVRTLLEVCVENTEDEDNREDILLEFGFEKIFKCLCEDLVQGSVLHKMIRKFFNIFG